MKAALLAKLIARLQTLDLYQLQLVDAALFRIVHAMDRVHLGLRELVERTDTSNESTEVA